MITDKAVSHDTGYLSVFFGLEDDGQAPLQMADRKPAPRDRLIIVRIAKAQGSPAIRDSRDDWLGRSSMNYCA